MMRSRRRRRRRRRRARCGSSPCGCCPRGSRCSTPTASTRAASWRAAPPTPPHPCTAASLQLRIPARLRFALLHPAPPYPCTAALRAPQLLDYGFVPTDNPLDTAALAPSLLAAACAAVRAEPTHPIPPLAPNSNPGPAPPVISLRNPPRARARA